MMVNLDMVFGIKSQLELFLESLCEFMKLSLDVVKKKIIIEPIGIRAFGCE